MFYLLCRREAIRGGHLIRGGGGGEGGMVFFVINLFDCQFKHTIFFRPYKKNNFFSAVEHKTILFTIYFI